MIKVDASWPIEITKDHWENEPRTCWIDLADVSFIKLNPYYEDQLTLYFQNSRELMIKLPALLPTIDLFVKRWAIEKKKQNDQAMEYEKLKQPFNIEIDGIIGMTILGNMQLALRHKENNGESSIIAEVFARRLQAVLSEKFPEYSALMEMGWSCKFDMES